MYFTMNFVVLLLSMAGAILGRTLDLFFWNIMEAINKYQSHYGAELQRVVNMVQIQNTEYIRF